MVGHGAKFGRKKEEAIAALLTQRNIEEAARTAGMAPRPCFAGSRCRNSKSRTVRPAVPRSDNR